MYISKEKLSGAEKYKNYVANLKKNGKYEDYKKRKAMELKIRRKEKLKKEKDLPKKNQEDIIKARRLAGRDRVRKHREQKKINEKTHSNVSPTQKLSITLKTVLTRGYRSSATLGKAVSKVQRALPTSPKKKQAVLAKLISTMPTDSQGELISSTSLNRKKVSFSDSELIESIQDFYYRDDISRTSPNVKDVKTYKTATGESVNKSIRHMLYTIKEAYALFMEHQTNASNSKFLIIKL